MEKFFELPEITRKMTIGDLLESWLDVSLSVQEDCLHLAVYTPVNPSTPELVQCKISNTSLHEYYIYNHYSAEKRAARYVFHPWWWV
jgi:hypothetical protein